MLKKLENIIQEVGKEILKFKENNIITKNIVNNHLKTNIDLYVDKILKKKLKTLKNIPIISEESRKIDFNNKQEFWLIDPIDGTKSLVDGYKGWVTQVAYIKYNIIKISVVYAPELDELYSGSIYSKKIYFNKKKFIKSNINTSFPIFIDNYSNPNLLYKKLFKNFKKYKYIECGSIGLKMCRVVFGSADCFIKDVTVRDWDIAPALLFAQIKKIDVYDYNYFEYKISNNFKKKGLIILSKRYEKLLKKYLK